MAVSPPPIMAIRSSPLSVRSHTPFQGWSSSRSRAGGSSVKDGLPSGLPVASTTMPA
ncbi:MAG: Uncharacterised protein [SAR116 cluster bacterium MED-G04]|nr:MAG: Uncharacterised protein [SAR116 cluster bacterium MED-G04]